MKALYRHKTSGDIFAIETDVEGNVLSSAGPLLGKDFDPQRLNYDDYFTSEVRAKIKDFERVTKGDYIDILLKNGFCIESVQRYLF